MRASLFFLFILCNFLSFSQSNWTATENQRSDTIDILHYEVYLDLTQGNRYIIGDAAVTFVTKQNAVSKINLDLHRFTVDSVKSKSGTNLSFTRQDSALSIQIPQLNAGDSGFVHVYYRGIPFEENWGGWHYRRGLDFNLGVGFQSIPHNLGKSWHPCFDNFVERASYRVTVKAVGSSSGSGVLESHVDLGNDTTLRTWYLKDPIPTYLFGLAAGRLHMLDDTISGLNGKIPVELYAQSGDTNYIKGVTRNLDTTFQIYEGRFGPYWWDKVGYTVTATGAMEHATNIALPSSAGETTMAHELAHHWWGDLITCQTDRDMWINEGMAVFCEYLFLEGVNGRQAMVEDMEENLYQVVKNAHLRDGDHYPLSGIPRVHTYSTHHTYWRGGLIANNLRTFLGDSLYFSAAKVFLDSFKFNSVNSYDYRDVFSSVSGIDLTDFFDRWVFEPGLPAVVVEGFKITPSTGLNKVELTLRQLKAASTHFHKRIPLEVQFTGQNWDAYVESLELTQEVQSFVFQLPIVPAMVHLNPRQKLNYGMTAATEFVYSTGSVNTHHTDISVRVEELSDSALIRTECHWTGANISTKNAGDLQVRMHPGRHWRISGVGGTKLKLSANLNFSARKGQYDYGLIKDVADSVILLYRSRPEDDWVEHPYYSKVVPVAGDSILVFDIDSLFFGEYALAERDTTIKIDNSIFTERNQVLKALIYPNPTKGKVTFEVPSEFHGANIILLDYQGREWSQKTSIEKNTKITLDISSFTPGVYFYLIERNATYLDYGRIVKTDVD